jgi:hypothetical protein
MSQCAFFVSAPTIRFLQAMEQVRLLPAPQRRQIAADVYSEIKPLVGTRNADRLGGRARAAQDERWRLISSGVREITDVRFARTAIAEQWVLAQLELLRPASPVAEVLAERRHRAIEDFVSDNLSFETGEVIQLRGHGAAASSTGRPNASKSAA